MTKVLNCCFHITISEQKIMKKLCVVILFLLYIDDSVTGLHIARREVPEGGSPFDIDSSEPVDVDEALSLSLKKGDDSSQLDAMNEGLDEPGKLDGSSQMKGDRGMSGNEEVGTLEIKSAAPSSVPLKGSSGVDSDNGNIEMDTNGGSSNNVEIDSNGDDKEIVNSGTDGGNTVPPTIHHAPDSNQKPDDNFNSKGESSDETDTNPPKSDDRSDSIPLKGDSGADSDNSKTGMDNQDQDGDFDSKDDSNEKSDTSPPKSDDRSHSIPLKGDSGKDSDNGNAKMDTNGDSSEMDTDGDGDEKLDPGTNGGKVVLPTVHYGPDSNQDEDADFDSEDDSNEEFDTNPPKSDDPSSEKKSNRANEEFTKKDRQPGSLEFDTNLKESIYSTSSTKISTESAGTVTPTDTPAEDDGNPNDSSKEQDTNSKEGMGEKDPINIGDSSRNILTASTEVDLTNKDQDSLSSTLKYQSALSTTPNQIYSQKTTSTKKAVITARSTTENNQLNTSRDPPQSSRTINSPTPFRTSFPWTSIYPYYSSTTALHQPAMPTYPRPYYAGPTTRPRLGESVYSSPPKYQPSSFSSESTDTSKESENTTHVMEISTTTSLQDSSASNTTVILPTTEATSEVETTAFSATSIFASSSAAEKDLPTTTVAETTTRKMVIDPSLETDMSPVLITTSSSTEVVLEPTEPHPKRKRPPLDPGKGREGGSTVPDGTADNQNDEHETSAVPTSPVVKVSLESSSAEVPVSNEPDVISQLKKYGKNFVKQVGALKVSLILLAIVGLSFISIFCCCKLCRKKGYRMRQRKLKEFGQEKEFLLRDRNKGNKYSNDTVTLLDGSSEDEF